ncbi:MAG: hypothetical protein BMS9Abin36_2263 [Gammaproteobacteria bacterium]|nr:MAG: hypothetical protein BMS9Abin36_2263 [Gammaproteobacteria bacterium]
MCIYINGHSLLICLLGVLIWINYFQKQAARFILIRICTEWHLLKPFATEAHGITRKKEALIELFPCFSVCFRGQSGIFIDDIS